MRTLTSRTSSGAGVPPGRARHGLYAFIAVSLAFLISVLAFVRPSLHPIFWFAGRLFRNAAASYRFHRGLGFGVTAPYLVAEAVLNVLTWAVLIFAAELWFHRRRTRSSSGLTT